MNPWIQWLRSCPLWKRATPELTQTILTVTPSVLSLSMGNAFQGKAYGDLHAEWDDFDADLAANAKTLVVIAVPDGMVY